MGKYSLKNAVPVLLALGGLASYHPAANAADAPKVPLPATPPQDQGLPYTRTARSAALALIKDSLAVFPGSRYAYLNGLKIRLDEKDWQQEAVLQNGTLFVPKAFAAVLAIKEPKAETAPPYLAERWVYTIDRPAVDIPANVPAVDIDGQPYVDLVALAKALNLKAVQHPRGVVLVGANPPTLENASPAQIDSVVTLFDTPEKFADPDIATRYVPTLARQGKWTDHVKVTAGQLKILNGPETKWPTAPQSSYDYTGFNQQMLGSKVPAPGVYPRILFSPEDVPGIAQRIKQTKSGQKALIEMEYLFRKSWWDPKTSDGQVFEKLAKGDLAGLDFDVPPDTSPTAYPAQFKGQKPGVFNTHVAYVPECLTTMAFYCLLINDDAHGRMAAAAIANYYKIREPELDETDAISDTQFGGTYTRPNGATVTMEGNGGKTHWRTVQGIIAHMNLGLSLDFAGKWMTAGEKDTMRRIIAKATYGRRSYGQDGPTRFRDVNWVAWDLPDFIAVTAIEGLEGFDRESYESGRRTVKAFCDWGIDDSGVIYESNGKTPGSMEFQTISMTLLARRGENLFGHPHFRKLLTGQIQITSPDQVVTVNSGTQYAPWSRSPFSLQVVQGLKAFYPDDRRADYLLSRANAAPPGDEYYRSWQISDFDPAAYKEQVADEKRLRLPSPTYPGFVQSVLFAADYVPTTRKDLDLPLDFNAPVHGVFSSYSDATPDAAWINMLVRPDHYLGAGHHHADAGMFHFSALGVDWFTQSPFSGNYDGRYFNLVQVDGHSEPEAMPGIANGYQAAATYLGSQSTPEAAFASADLTNSYSYRWLTQPPQVWQEGAKDMGWEMDPSDYIAKMFAGTARYKMRPWWANYTYSNYIATSRAPFNPMQFVHRTTGLIRGPHPYGVVADDLKKDNAPHLYQWAAMLNGGVWRAAVPGLPQGLAALAYRPLKTDVIRSGKADIQPAPGEPLLLVCALGEDQSPAGRPLIEVTSEAGPADKKGAHPFYDRLMINRHAVDAHFRVLLVPVRAGEPLPAISYDAPSSTATIAWNDQQDRLTFAAGDNVPSKVTLQRSH